MNKHIDDSVIEDAVEMMNDAKILGEEHPDMVKFLEQQMVFMTGDLYGQQDRRNTRDGKWKRVEMPLIQWMVGGDGWGLTRHPVGKSKGGASIVPSENLEGQRKDAAVKTMYAIGIDIDSGTTLDHTLDKLEEAGYFALVYTTFNHRKTRMELKSDAVIRAMKLEDAPTKSQVQEYLRDHHKDNLPPEFIESIKVINNKEHTAEGLMIILETPPIDKYRVIFPLAEPVDLADLAPTMPKWKEAWADLVTGVAVNILDANFDASSCDVNRLFYTPRHAKGGEYYSAVVLGKPLAIEDIKPHSKDKFVRQRKSGGDPFLADAGEEEVNRPDMFNTPSGMNLNDWHRKAKDRFLVADVLETCCQDKLRKAGGERSETVHLECPFEHWHTNAGGTATMAMNPDANSEGVWTVFCRHDSCSGRHKLEFLSQMLEDAWFPEDVLTEDGFLIPLPDQDQEDAAFQALKDGPIKDHKTEDIQTALANASINQDSTEADIEAFMRRCLDGGADKMARGRITAEIVSATPLGKRDLNRIWSGLIKEKKVQKQNASKDAPLNTGFGFDLVFDQTVERLHASNEKDPFLFEMRGELFELRKTPDGPKLKMLNYDGLSELISRHVKFARTEGETTKSISPPHDVVKHVFHRERTDYALPLVAISEVPFFDKGGNLVCKNGYDAGSGVYLSMPDGFVVPRVSERPSDEELDQAFDLFLEVMCEFPFDGLSPDEIANNQSASLANVIGLTCLPFMRLMIEGPTPGHLFNKPNPGTGAGLLLYILHMIWTGRKPTVMTIPKRREEIPKTIIAKLRSGAGVVIFDNIPDNLDSDDLAVALSEGALDARVLGRNDAGAVDPVEISAVWIFTGNDVTMSDELLRRMTLIELDSGMTSPETRTFTKSEPDLKAWVRDNRERLVWASLTLIQNWISRGRQPFHSDHVKGTFSEWLAAVGGVMQSADLHHHFYGNEVKLREDSSSAGEDALFTFASVLADYLPGHLFHVGGDDPSSFLNLLNDGPDGSPIELHGWGYSQEDGTYGSASGLGKHIKKFSRRPHKARRTVEDGYIDVEIGLEREYDEHAKVNAYRLKFREPGAKEWIKATTDVAWDALLKR